MLQRLPILSSGSLTPLAPRVVVNLMKGNRSDRKNGIVMRKIVGKLDR